ncbi:MAG: T9SS type A sorting domain-containing protein [Melioribacteraceae bacterium]|nr:T9SS type A sorting domain-containing protein [Melioribacteraceae bacterium]
MQSTGGWQNWQSHVIEDIELTQGTHELLVQFFFGGFNINYFEFVQTVVGVDEEEDKPLNYELNQNYPNPFNPETNIEYSITQNSFVKLKVYDVLGNEITTLVDEEKFPGKHKVKFNADELSTGIYLYKISSGDYTETRKMLYLK